MKSDIIDMITPSQKCSDCKCWEYKENEFGICRARAPIAAVSSESGSFKIIWPATHKNDYCINDFKCAEVN